MKLTIRNFAQIANVDIDTGAAGDLTILVGQQATGKSLALQWLKLVTDAQVIRRDWERYGFNWRSGEPLRPLELFFGEGVGRGYRTDTAVQLDDRVVDLASLFHKPKTGDSPVERTYYIPAHRALLLADGWPRNFQQHGPGTPYVARAQSERLARWLGDIDKSIFPLRNRLPKEIRDLFNDAIFHGASLEADRSSPLSRLVLSVAPGQSIPFMAWTAGQREFVPLLLALYELMPAGKVSRLSKSTEADVSTVVLEEPELGLHPQALFAVGIVILHLMHRGYRVVVSSHSPLLVDFAWAINRFRVASEHQAVAERQFRAAFDLRSTDLTKSLATSLLRSKARTYFLRYEGDGRVRSKDISHLATFASDPEESSWGELLKYSTRLAQVVGSLDLDFSELHGETGAGT